MANNSGRGKAINEMKKDLTQWSTKNNKRGISRTYAMPRKMTAFAVKKT